MQMINRRVLQIVPYASWLVFAPRKLCLLADPGATPNCNNTSGPQTQWGRGAEGVAEGKVTAQKNDLLL